MESGPSCVIFRLQEFLVALAGNSSYQWSSNTACASEGSVWSMPSSSFSTSVRMGNKDVKYITPVLTASLQFGVTCVDPLYDMYANTMLTRCCPKLVWHQRSLRREKTRHSKAADKSLQMFCQVQVCEELPQELMILWKRASFPSSWLISTTKWAAEVSTSLLTSNNVRNTKYRGINSEQLKFSSDEPGSVRLTHCWLKLCKSDQSLKTAQSH